MPSFVALSISFSSLIISMTADAATHDSGLPPKVLACEPPSQSIILAFATVAPNGSPAAIDLAIHMISGSTFQCSIAHHFPVLPTPD